MTIKIEGDIEVVRRVKTGLFSLDKSFAGIDEVPGVPVSFMELAGPTGCGKSTLAYAILGLVAKNTNKGFILADLETLDGPYFISCLETSGFDGIVHNISRPTNEEMLDELIVQLRRDDMVGSLFDSVGAISPIQEVVEKHGAANMGRRAKLMAAHMRKNIYDRRYNPQKDNSRLCIYINHLVANLGSPGMVTPGGSAIKYINVMHVRVKGGEVFPKKTDGENPVAFTIDGTVKKNRHGYVGRKFSVFVVSGLGVHPGMTALWDCINYGLVKRGKTLSIDGKSVGYLKGFIESAINKDNSAFDVFYELLESHKPKQIEVVKKEIEEDEENTEDGNDIDRL